MTAKQKRVHFGKGRLNGVIAESIQRTGREIEAAVTL